MKLNFRFAVISDLHIALPETIWDHPSRFHLVEISIPGLELVLQHLQQLDLDFLLIPGDLTQHGEPSNHQWLAERLSQLPFPVYVIPGNHDVPVLEGNHQSIAWADFPKYYQGQGYQYATPTQQLYYTCKIFPGVRLIALNSNQFNRAGKQIGCLDQAQLDWLIKVLDQHQNELIIVMVHHNLVEHLPDQSNHILGRRYMLANAPVVLNILQQYGVQLVFTGHLHVQHIASTQGVYDITTGSLVSYPHPYRVCKFTTDDVGQKCLEIASYRVNNLPNWSNLLEYSRQWMGDRSFPFIFKLLTEHPLYLCQEEALKLAPQLRYFWADIAEGDRTFNFPDFPPLAQAYFQSFSSNHNDNNAIIKL